MSAWGQNGCYRTAILMAVHLNQQTYQSRSKRAVEPADRGVRCYERLRHGRDQPTRHCAKSTSRMSHTHGGVVAHLQLELLPFEAQARPCRRRS